MAVVSSANRDAVLEEWGKYGLLDHVDLVLAQGCRFQTTLHCHASGKKGMRRTTF